MLVDADDDAYLTLLQPGQKRERQERRSNGARSPSCLSMGWLVLSGGVGRSQSAVFDPLRPSRPCRPGSLSDQSQARVVVGRPSPYFPRVIR